MGAIASQVTSRTIVYSTIYSGADQRKHQSLASLAFVRGIHQWPVNARTIGPVMRKMFPFDVVIMVLAKSRLCIIWYFVVCQTVDAENTLLDPTWDFIITLLTTKHIHELLTADGTPIKIRTVYHGVNIMLLPMVKFWSANFRRVTSVWLPQYKFFVH